ncbi:MAG TPA: amidohydrolase [Thermoanaerobaculia bacterium]|nr:amidohydrolase [Thermoanaerobaculia bacterium]
MRIIPRSIAATFLLAALCCASAGPPDSIDSRREVDLIVSGGTVLTMAGPNIPAGAVAIDRGEIVAVGPASRIEASLRARDRIDARGGAILPGLVNAHTHVPMVLFRGIADDLPLMEWLQSYIFPAEAKNVDAEFVRWGTRLAAAEMIRTGTTTFADMYYFEAEIARETRDAGLRAVLGETLLDFPAPDNATWTEAIAYVRAFVEEFRDDPLITPAFAPHAPFTVSREHLEQVRRLATEMDAPILIHLAETEDEVRQVREAQGLTPVAYLDSIGFLGSDVVAAHTVHLTDEEIAILARRGVGSAHNPESNMMLASGVAPVTALRAAGVDVGIGTDGPAGSNNDLDMIAEMASAARLQKIFRNDPRALSARDVLEMATIGGARVLGLADRVGTLEPGKRADLIVIDLSEPGTQPVYSVESAIVYATSGEHVTTTIVDGRILMRDRVILTVDESSVLEKAREYRDRILESLGKEQ